MNRLKTGHYEATDAASERWTPTRLVRLSICVHVASALIVIVWPASWPWLLAGLLGNHLLLGVVGMWPRSQWLGVNLVTVPKASDDGEHVALTFDDGPDPDVTPRVLDLLDQHGAKASFFCIGTLASLYPAIVRDIVRRGHSVENHSHRHSNAFACYLPGRLHRDIEQAQAALEAISGLPPRFFRSPMGLRSPLLDPVLMRLALRYVSWTRRGLDSVSRDPAKVLRRLTRGLAAGDVLLLHDGACARMHDGNPVVLAVLPALLDRLAARGLRAVSLPMALSGR